MRTRIILIILAIIILIARDFVKPFSLEYLFSCFKSTEADYIWGIIGTIPAIFAIVFSFLIVFLITLSWIIPVVIAICIAILNFFIGLRFLPSVSLENISV